jgi:hypothetical protein
MRFDPGADTTETSGVYFPNTLTLPTKSRFLSGSSGVFLRATG